MTGYSCRYAPVELLRACGAEPLLLDQEFPDFEQADALTHSNMCCHAKAMIQQGSRQEELVITDCCDALRRSYDVLEETGGPAFLHLLDLPHEENGCAKKRLAMELYRLKNAYCAYKGTQFDRAAFLEACRQVQEPVFPAEPFIAVLGARVSPPLLEEIAGAFPLPVVNLTCSGQRQLAALPPQAEAMEEADLLDWYAGALLGMVPCMRMSQVASRKSLSEHPLLRGIVYNTVKFCDFYGFDYAALQLRSALPMLKIESDYMPQPAGQLATRLEAFAESLGLEARTERKALPEKARKASGLYAGIDSGSTTTNMVVIDRTGNVKASAIVRTGARAQNGARAALNAVLEKLNLKEEDLEAIVATGYGRNNIPFATDTKTEITCHARGAAYLHPQTRTIVDIGGQDSKVICLDETGGVKNFIMNDKCAAGTGRFLEAMARTLELDLETMARKGTDWKQDLTISSMCTVFAESEVISLIADNHTDADIIHGLNKSIAAKTASMVSRARAQGPYMMTGGVARNKGVVAELEERLGASLYIAPDPDLCGALGAALFAREEQADSGHKQNS